MLEIIDLSQEIFHGMPVFPSLPQVEITIHVTHRFRFVGLPLKIRGGTGSPVRAIAVFDSEVTPAPERAEQSAQKVPVELAPLTRRRGAL